MKRIRIGNDINIEWSVKRYGQPENFYGRNLILKMVDPNNREHTMEFTTEGNVIRTTFLGMNQELCGSYSLVLVENSMEVGMTTIDKTVAFILVPHSYMESGVDPEGLITTSDNVNIETEITLPADGLSAYEIAVKNGYEGTEQEWLQSLVGAPGSDGSDANVTKENIEKALGYVPDSGAGQMMIAEDETVTGKKTFVGQIGIENTDLDKNGGVILRSEPYGVVNKTDQLFVIGTKGSANIKVERDPVDDLELATRRFVIKEAEKRQAKLTAGYGITIDPSNRISVSLDLSVFKVVTVLPEYPASGDENKIHLIPASKSAEQNIYTEYVYVNGVWEKLGEYNPAGGGLSEMMLSTTYSNLVSLRDSNHLIPGMQYRITDYQCTTIQGNTKSAGHPFDIIVRADSVSTLNEEAFAIQHEGDTYFASCNLSAWKIWYCLDNDTTRFAWATPNDDPEESVIDTIKPAIGESGSGTYTYNIPISKIKFFSKIYNLEIGVRTQIYSGPPAYITRTDAYTLVVEDEYKLLASTKGISVYKDPQVGKGVIYRMIDEFNNDLPYDFKNIQFKHPDDTTIYHYYYTFSGVNVDNNTDYSLSVEKECYSNTIREYVISGKRVLNNILFIGLSCYNNSFGFSCYNNVLGSHNSSNTFGSHCHDIIFNYYCVENFVGNHCSEINMSGNGFLFNNRFGDNCNKIRFESWGSTPTGAVKNYNFVSGLSGNGKNIIIKGEKYRNYETRVEIDSNGVLKTYCLADLIASENDGSYPYSASFIGEI